MPVVKTPTSSLTSNASHRFIQSLHCANTTIACELLINRIWYRTIAEIKPVFRRGAPEVSTACSSPATRLPPELIETIISYLVYDTRSLLACSMTCYSWYIAAVPQLHHTLTTENDSSRPRDRKHLWPQPLKGSYKLGLLPFVKRFRTRLGQYDGFTPKWLGRHTLHYFSALTNLQELGIDNFQVSKFMPNIRQYFGHFSPALRFLALKEPDGSCRQILCFIGLFPNLQDLKLHSCLSRVEEDSTVDETLVPLSIPPLRGRLTLTCFTREKLVKDMIALFGGLRFSSMDVFRVRCVQLLLDACAETLETLRLYPNDEYGEEFFERRKEKA